MIINFGKYRGFNLYDVAEADPSYIFWLYKETDLELPEDLLEKASNTVDLDVPIADIAMSDLPKADRTSKRPGMLVFTKSGIPGRTYSNELPINGKIKVYTLKGNMLCTPESLTVKAHIN